MTKSKETVLRKPSWLKIKLGSGESYSYVGKIIKEHGLHTICTSGKCPNQGECWNAGTATFMILGEICTRVCKFCATKSGKPLPVNPKEPYEIAESVRLLKLKHCVLTSVDRDDLEDGGAGHWAETIRKTKEINPTTTIECLIPDFNGDENLVGLVANEKPEIITHNLETVRRLTPEVRSKAKYDVSLKVLKSIADAGCTSKSGIMVGLGETHEEILETMDDLLSINCKIITIGQYLQPTKQHLPVLKYVTPEEFDEYKVIAQKKGFNYVESAPLVRSSYHAERAIE